MALDLVDLDAPVALWLVVAIVLEDAGAEGLSVGRVAFEVEQRSGGRFRRKQSVGHALARLVELELVRFTKTERGGRSPPSHMHTLTARGQALLAATRGDVARILHGEFDDGPTSSG